MGHSIFLYAEDETYRGLLAHVLEGAGHAVLAAEADDSVLAQLMGKNYDVLIFDLTDEDAALASTLATLGAGKSVPCITLAEDGAGIGELGLVHVHMDKPFEPVHLLKAIEGVLAQAGGGADAAQDAVQAEHGAPQPAGAAEQDVSDEADTTSNTTETSKTEAGSQAPEKKSGGGYGKLIAWTAGSMFVLLVVTVFINIYERSALSPTASVSGSAKPSVASQQARLDGLMIGTWKIESFAPTECGRVSMHGEAQISRKTGSGVYAGKIRQTLELISLKKGAPSKCDIEAVQIKHIDDEIRVQVSGDRVTYDVPADPGFGYISYRLSGNRLIIEDKSVRETWTKLTPGAIAADARELQSLLYAMAYLPGGIDGKIGPNTRRAMDAFRAAWDGKNGVSIPPISDPRYMAAVRGIALSGGAAQRAGSHKNAAELAQALKRLTILAKQGNQYALADLARLYRKGNVKFGLKPNPPLADKLEKIMRGEG